MKVIDRHPCFSKAASRIYGRIHLPVAPACNIGCNYCERLYDCVNESRPGVTSRVIGPEEAIKRVEYELADKPFITVVGIAGPGDPLCNEETFETLRLVHARFPLIGKCLSTNGLLLPRKVAELQALGVKTVTVTVNAVDPSICARIVSLIRLPDGEEKGPEAAEILIDNQLLGIEMASEAGIAVKVNTVLIPTINDRHITSVAEAVAERGAHVQNIMPLIPLGRFSHISPASPADLRAVRRRCAPIIRQITHCRQCRADAIGLLSR